MDASPDEEEEDAESDDEHSDTDTDTDTETKMNSLLHKSVPIMDYEKNLAKRWPQQKQRQLRPPTPPDTGH